MDRVIHGMWLAMIPVLSPTKTPLGSIEAGLSLVRSLAFFAPGGLGLVDAGYLALVTALSPGDAGATAAAFVLVKRAKELTWIGVGAVLGVVLTRGRRREAAAYGRRAASAE